MSKRRTRIRRKKPKTREECRCGPRPCPWVSCKYHLYLDVNPVTGTIKINFPEKEIWELEHTCALDLAEEGAQSFEEIGRRMNLTRERIRQLNHDCLSKMQEGVFPEGNDDSLPVAQEQDLWACS